MPTETATGTGTATTNATGTTPTGNRTRDRNRQLTTGERRAVTGVATATGFLGLIGFINSFARVNTAAGPSFGWFAWTVPLGIDIGIAVFSALDIVLARLDMRPRWLRLIPWTLTAATVYLNVSGETTLFGQVAHTVLPGLWVIAVEVGAHAIRVRAGLTSTTRMDRIRRSRWMLALPSTALLWRRMVLWEIRSYPDALGRERGRVLAVADLRERYGRRWKRHATPRELALYRLGELAPVTTGPVPAPIPVAVPPVAVPAIPAPTPGRPEAETSTTPAPSTGTSDRSRATGTGSNPVPRPAPKPAPGTGPTALAERTDEALLAQMRDRYRDRIPGVNEAHRDLQMRKDRASRLVGLMRSEREPTAQDDPEPAAQEA